MVVFQTLERMLFTKRNERTKRLERFAALKTAKIHENPGCIGILADFADIGDFRFYTFGIERSDRHPMGAHRKSLQKPSQHNPGTSQTEGEQQRPLLHPLTMSTNIEDFAICCDRTLQNPYVVEGER